MFQKGPWIFDLSDYAKAVTLQFDHSPTYCIYYFALWIHIPFSMRNVLLHGNAQTRKISSRL